MWPTVVLLLPTTAYRADDFLAAAERLAVRIVAVSDRCHVLAQEWTQGPLAIEFRDAEAAATRLAETLASARPAAVVGVDDQTAVIAALAAAKLGLPHNPPEAVRAARNKAESRERLRRGGVATPRFEVVPRDLEGPALEALLSRAPYPCVVKPLILSGSRGVMRADDAAGLRSALARLSRLLQSPQVAERRDPELTRVLIEEFIPGAEVALEGLLTGGRLHVLALFDKPDPLDGPFFEETLYVTPSRHPPALQRSVAEAVAQAAAALGLREGPVHAELRLSPAGPRILEVAARSIGGLCGRALRFGVGVTLEELVLRHALGEIAGPARDRSAAGVLMLPIRRGGVLEEVRGVEAAKALPLIEDVAITAHLREELVALPEGASYLGFAFARGETPEAVEAALRAAGARIEPVVIPKLQVTRAG
jgi:biotin carboxylase